MKRIAYVIFFVTVLLSVGELRVRRGLALSPDGLSLLAFKSAVSDDPTGALSAWSEDDADPCRWPGISCANVSGFPDPRVVGVAISGKNLSGYVPSELGTLVFLRRLNLHGNRLSGGIPAQLFNASSLHSLFLYDNNLTGPLPPALCDLPRLQNVDLSRNSLSGSLPPELRGCRQLQRLLLQQNRISSAIKAGIWSEMVNLVQLDLSSNDFTGPLPPDLGELDSLSGTLNLSHNRFSGEIPATLGNLPSTVSLDLRWNNFSGEIPQAGSLANQGPTAFLNNPGLCGFPLQIPCQEGRPAPPPPATGRGSTTAVAPEERRGLRPAVIVLISVADAAGVALLGLIVVCSYWRLRDREHGCSCTGKGKLGGGGGKGGWRGWWRAPACAGWPSAGEEEEEEGESAADGGGGGGGEGELVAIDKGFSFELDELLRASAYVLGKSGLGIVYKVVLGNGVPVAVRRLGEGGTQQRYKEFAAEAQAIGKVRHPNIVRLRAYYWAPDEKLLITDFISNGNLASALRGRSGQPSLSWSLRLRIAKGAARGLAHLHECSPRKFIHGDVKPTNVLLDADFNPFISDFGLFRLLSITSSASDPSSSNSISSSAGGGAGAGGGFMGGALPLSKSNSFERPNPYRAPEARLAGAGVVSVAGGRPTQKWDVYSFGVVLLEMLTGRPPEVTLPSPSTSSSAAAAEPELVRWVRRGFEEAKPLAELVDPVLLREAHAKKEVVAAFHVALACTEADPELRPRMKTVSENLDKIGP